MPPGRRHPSLQGCIHGVARETSPGVRPQRVPFRVASLRTCDALGHASGPLRGPHDPGGLRARPARPAPPVHHPRPGPAARRRRQGQLRLPRRRALRADDAAAARPGSAAVRRLDRHHRRPRPALPLRRDHRHARLRRIPPEDRAVGRQGGARPDAPGGGGRGADRLAAPPAGNSGAGRGPGWSRGAAERRRILDAQRIKLRQHRPCPSRPRPPGRRYPGAGRGPTAPAVHPRP